MASPGNVLIVDDMPDARTLLRILLSKKGSYAVLEAADGREALNQAQQHAPDLIILDYMMPDLDGVEVIKALRTNSKTAHIPIIMLTARIDYAARDRAIEAGANCFMNKPLKPLELLQETQRLIEESRATAH